MRKALICLAGVALLAACSKAPTDAHKADAAAPAAAPQADAGPPATATPAAAAPVTSGPAVSGVYTGNGKPAALTQVTARNDEPFDGKPVVVLVFTAKDQGGDPKADFEAAFGKYGDAIVARVQPDGTVIGAELLHAGARQEGGGAVSVSGVLTMKNYRVGGGQISGELTSGGQIDVFGQKLDIDLTFHTKAP